VKRMVRDLNFPLKIVVAPILREADGWAMSSRTSISSAICARRRLCSGWRCNEHGPRSAERPPHSSPRGSKQRSSGSSHRRRRPALIMWSFLISNTLAPVSKVTDGVHLALADVHRQDTPDYKRAVLNETV